ncbi:MAG: phosphohistidine phosphatase SixA [Pseudomonadota bacterium]
MTDAHMGDDKTVWILRHGDATHQAPSDALRELTPKGLTHIQQQAEFMTQQGVTFDAVWVSPYVRAQQSAQMFLSGLSVTASFDTVNLLQPDSLVSSLVTHLSRHAPSRLLIVSHQPLVNRLINVLCDGDARLGRAEFLNTSSLACLRSSEWIPGWASVDCIQHVTG